MTLPILRMNLEQSMFVQCRRYEGAKRGRAHLTDAYAPHLGLLKILFWEHHSMTRQHTMMEKGIIAFKHYCPLTLSRFFAKLLSTNCCVA